MTRDEEWLLKEKYKGKESSAFSNDCRRLENGEPLAYIIGSIPFLNTTIFLESHPLIPRTETEFWVERAISEIRLSAHSEVHILDICAGSGCIGVAVLHALEKTCVDFAEIDTGHHATILKNITENNIPLTRTRVFGGSLFSEVVGTYDFILSNPPYINKDLGRVASEVKTHEPPRALYGGKDGMELITEIIREAPKYLSPTGVLFLEHEPEQVTDIHTRAKESGFIASTHKDQYGVLRYTRLTRSTSKTVPQ